MKKDYPVYHNNMLEKKDNFIGPEWKMYPHKIDIGSNDFNFDNQILIRSNIQNVINIFIKLP